MTAHELSERIFDSRQERDSHPDGDFDKAGRFYPSDWEWCGCCNGVRGPSRSYPYSLMKHCRTRRHVQALVAQHGTDDPALLREAKNGRIREQVPANRACPDGIAYKALAIGEDGRLYSVYDGSPWLLGVERHDRALQDHNGGLYVFETQPNAARAPFPDDSVLSDADRAIVRCRVRGSYCRYGAKLAFSHVMPEAVVKIV